MIAAASMMLRCETPGLGHATLEPWVLQVAGRHARAVGQHDEAFRFGFTVRPLAHGASRLTAVVANTPENDIWADLMPQGAGRYALQWHSAPHGVKTPTDTWAERCVRLPAAKRKAS